MMVAEQESKIDHESLEEPTWTQRLEVKGENLVDHVKEWIEEGNVRRLIIRSVDDTVLLEVPLTAGIAAGGALLLLKPTLAALAALAALVTRVKVDVVRVEDRDLWGTD